MQSYSQICRKKYFFKMAFSISYFVGNYDVSFINYINDKELY